MKKQVCKVLAAILCGTIAASSGQYDADRQFRAAGVHAAVESDCTCIFAREPSLKCSCTGNAVCYISQDSSQVIASIF